MIGQSRFFDVGFQCRVGFVCSWVLFLRLSKKVDNPIDCVRFRTLTFYLGFAAGERLRLFLGAY